MSAEPSIFIAPKGLYVPASLIWHVRSSPPSLPSPPDFRWFLRIASAPGTLFGFLRARSRFSMLREITENQHVLSYIEARNLLFFQKRGHFFGKMYQFCMKFMICGGWKQQEFQTIRKNMWFVRFAMDTLILRIPFGATLPCGCNLVLFDHQFERAKDCSARFIHFFDFALPCFLKSEYDFSKLHFCDF